MVPSAMDRIGRQILVRPLFDSFLKSRSIPAEHAVVIFA
jgi:hypothetical protein